MTKLCATGCRKKDCEADLWFLCFLSSGATLVPPPVPLPGPLTPQLEGHQRSSSQQTVWMRGTTGKEPWRYWLHTCKLGRLQSTAGLFKDWNKGYKVNIQNKALNYSCWLRIFEGKKKNHKKKQTVPTNTSENPCTQCACDMPAGLGLRVLVNRFTGWLRRRLFAWRRCVKKHLNVWIVQMKSKLLAFSFQLTRNENIPIMSFMTARKWFLFFSVQLLSDPRHLQTCCVIACLLQRPSPAITTIMQLQWAKAYTKPTLLHLLPPTHASGTSQWWPVWGADLKRKMRSWWGAEGLAQRRPVEGCRAEKILRGTNKKTKKKQGKEDREEEGREK